MLERLQDILEREGARLVLELQSAMQSTGANASGKTSQSLRVTTRRTNTALNMNISGGIGWAFVEQGRGATRRSGNGAVRKAIRQWIDDKGITPDGNITKDALAFLITRAIHERGTLLHLLNERREIYTSVITENGVNEIIDKLGETVEVEVSSDVLKQIFK